MYTSLNNSSNLFLVVQSTNLFLPLLYTICRLGLRMYGWGQWKRIQPIVKTRTNKQIKSHAQKREKVNPEIKTKYTKGTCRRGRISSGTLANDAKILRSNGGDLMTAIACDDQHQFPPLEQMVKDVYQTNNGDGPNSRVRRYRHTPYHHSVYHPHSTKMVHSPGSMSMQGSVPEAGTTEQLSKGPCYTPGMEIYVRLSNGKWASDIIRTVNSSGSNHLYLLQYHGKVSSKGYAAHIQGVILLTAIS